MLRRDAIKFVNSNERKDKSMHQHNQLHHRHHPLNTAYPQLDDLKSIVKILYLLK